MPADGTPLVSIVVPAYIATSRHAELLDETLHTVDAQTCRDYEVVVDDGSPLDIAPVVARQANECSAVTRNTGNAASRDGMRVTQPPAGAFLGENRFRARGRPLAPDCKDTMRLSPLLLLAALAACDLPWDVAGSRITNLELQTQAAPAGTARNVVVSGEPGRIVIRGVLDLPAAYELRSYAQRRGNTVIAFVEARDYPASTAPARTLRYEATLRDLPRGRYEVIVNQYVQNEIVETLHQNAADTVVVVR